MVQERVVYEHDDRVEFYELNTNLRRVFADNAVALIPVSRISAAGVLREPQTTEAPPLCGSERFADQPAAAFCSGVLIGGDVVLTAGHCLRVFALPDFRVVTGFYYQGPGELALAQGEQFTPVSILDERLDGSGLPERLDFGLLKLDRAVSPTHQTPLVYRQRRALEQGAPLYFAAPSGGTPLKMDTGGKVIDARSAVVDWFLASTDSSHGASGGGAFDQKLGLVGILARGGSDLELTGDGCYRERAVPENSAAEEEFSYVAPAIEALCAREPERSLCRPDCDEPCQALPEAPAQGASCSFGAAQGSSVWLCALLVVAGAKRGKGRRSRSDIGRCYGSGEPRVALAAAPRARPS